MNVSFLYIYVVYLLLTCYYFYIYEKNRAPFYFSNIQ